MSFTGGTLGGGLFYGVNAIKSGTVHAPKNSQDMLYLVNQGKGKDIIDRIEQYRKRGAFGSTTISASKSVQDSQGDNVNITIDVEGYKEKQNYFIEKKVKKIARDVTLSKMDVKLDPMNSYERKVVHSALQGFKYVKTESEGEEPNRCVVIKYIENKED